MPLSRAAIARRPSALLALIGLAIAMIAAPVRREAQAGDACRGDCDRDGVVAIDDLSKLIAIALGTSALVSCPSGDPDGDHRVTVDEILAALAHALSGCPTQPRPSVTSTPTCSATASPSAIPTVPSPTPTTTLASPHISPSPTRTVVDCGAAPPQVKSLSQPDEHRSVTLSGSVFVHGPRSVLRVCDAVSCSTQRLASAHPVIQEFALSHVVPDGATQLEICTINEICGDIACTTSDENGAPLVVD